MDPDGSFVPIGRPPEHHCSLHPDVLFPQEQARQVDGDQPTALLKPATITNSTASRSNLPSGPLGLFNSWAAGGDANYSQGLFSIRYGHQVRLDGQITGGATARVAISRLPSDHYPTKARRACEDCTGANGALIAGYRSGNLRLRQCQRQELSAASVALDADVVRLGDRYLLRSRNFKRTGVHEVQP